MRILLNFGASGTGGTPVVRNDFAPPYHGRLGRVSCTQTPINSFRQLFSSSAFSVSRRSSIPYREIVPEISPNGSLVGTKISFGFSILNGARFARR